MNRIHLNVLQGEGWGNTVHFKTRAAVWLMLKAQSLNFNGKMLSEKTQSKGSIRGSLGGSAV